MNKNESFGKITRDQKQNILIQMLKNKDSFYSNLANKQSLQNKLCDVPKENINLHKENSKIYQDSRKFNFDYDTLRSFNKSNQIDDIEYFQNTQEGLNSIILQENSPNFQSINLKKENNFSLNLNLNINNNNKNFSTENTCSCSNNNITHNIKMCDNKNENKNTCTGNNKINMKNTSVSDTVGPRGPQSTKVSNNLDKEGFKYMMDMKYQKNKINNNILNTRDLSSTKFITNSSQNNPSSIISNKSALRYDTNPTNSENHNNNNNNINTFKNRVIKQAFYDNLQSNQNQNKYINNSCEKNNLLNFSSEMEHDKLNLKFSKESSNNNSYKNINISGKETIEYIKDYEEKLRDHLKRKLTEKFQDDDIVQEIVSEMHNFSQKEILKIPIKQKNYNSISNSHNSDNTQNISQSLNINNPNSDNSNSNPVYNLENNFIMNPNMNNINAYTRNKNSLLSNATNQTQDFYISKNADSLYNMNSSIVACNTLNTIKNNFTSLDHKAVSEKKPCQSKKYTPTSNNYTSYNPSSNNNTYAHINMNTNTNTNTYTDTNISNTNILNANNQSSYNINPPEMFYYEKKPEDKNKEKLHAKNNSYCLRKNPIDYSSINNHKNKNNYNKSNYPHQLDFDENLQPIENKKVNPFLDSPKKISQNNLNADNSLFSKFNNNKPRKVSNKNLLTNESAGNHTCNDPNPTNFKNDKLANINQMSGLSSSFKTFINSNNITDIKNSINFNEYFNKNSSNVKPLQKNFTNFNYFKNGNFKGKKNICMTSNADEKFKNITSSAVQQKHLNLNEKLNTDSISTNSKLTSAKTKRFVSKMTRSNTLSDKNAFKSYSINKNNINNYTKNNSNNQNENSYKIKSALKHKNYLTNINSNKNVSEVLTYPAHIDDCSSLNIDEYNRTENPRNISSKEKYNIHDINPNNEFASYNDSISDSMNPNQNNNFSKKKLEKEYLQSILKNQIKNSRNHKDIFILEDLESNTIGYGNQAGRTSSGLNSKKQLTNQQSSHSDYEHNKTNQNNNNDNNQKNNKPIRMNKNEKITNLSTSAGIKKGKEASRGSFPENKLKYDNFNCAFSNKSSNFIFNNKLFKYISEASENANINTNIYNNIGNNKKIIANKTKDQLTSINLPTKYNLNLNIKHYDRNKNYYNSCVRTDLAAKDNAENKNNRIRKSSLATKHSSASKTKSNKVRSYSPRLYRKLCEQPSFAVVFPNKLDACMKHATDKKINKVNMHSHSAKKKCISSSINKPYTNATIAQNRPLAYKMSFDKKLINERITPHIVDFHKLVGDSNNTRKLEEDNKSKDSSIRHKHTEQQKLHKNASKKTLTSEKKSARSLEKPSKTSSGYKNQIMNSLNSEEYKIEKSDLKKLEQQARTKQSLSTFNQNIEINKDFVRIDNITYNNYITDIHENNRIEIGIVEEEKEKNHSNNNHGNQCETEIAHMQYDTGANTNYQNYKTNKINLNNNNQNTNKVDANKYFSTLEEASGLFNTNTGKYKNKTMNNNINNNYYNSNFNNIKKNHLLKDNVKSLDINHSNISKLPVDNATKKLQNIHVSSNTKTNATSSANANYTNAKNLLLLEKNKAKINHGEYNSLLNNLKKASGLYSLNNNIDKSKEIKNHKITNNHNKPFVTKIIVNDPKNQDVPLKKEEGKPSSLNQANKNINKNAHENNLSPKNIDNDLMNKIINNLDEEYKGLFNFSYENYMNKEKSESISELSLIEEDIKDITNH